MVGLAEPDPAENPAEYRRLVADSQVSGRGLGPSGTRSKRNLFNWRRQKKEDVSPPGTQYVDSVIQFSCAMYYAMEGQDDEMKIDIVRLGNADREASCKYKTEDSSAKAGDKFVAAEGELNFAPGDTIQSISIPILNDDRWNTTLEFAITLYDVQGATKGLYLDQCRVKIIDDDSFPTNKYKEAFEKDEHESIPGRSLMMEFIKLTLQDPVIKWKALKIVIFDQFQGLYFFLTLYLQMYLIDTVLHPHPHEHAGGEPEGHEGGGEPEASPHHGGGEPAEPAGHGEPAGHHGPAAAGHSERRLMKMAVERGVYYLAQAIERRLTEEEGEEEEEHEGFVSSRLIIPHDRHTTALIVAVIYIAPFVFVHIFEYWKCYISLHGSLRKMIQGNLLRRFLNFREDKRQKMSSGELTMAMVRDVNEVVDNGYMKIINVMSITGKLLFALVFILAENTLGAVPIVVCPIILLFILIIREKKLRQCIEMQAHAQDEVVHSVTEAVKNYRVISDFSMQSVLVDKYEHEIDMFHKAESETLAIVTNNRLVSPWLTTLFIGGYMIMGASQVRAVGGTLSLGAFLATINIFKEVGKEIEEIYKELLEVARSYQPLCKIAYYMNTPTDMEDRMRMNRHRRSRGQAADDVARANSKDVIQEAKFSVDTVPITVENLTFGYREDIEHPIFKNVSVEFEQGKFYAILGDPHDGKATFMKLLGQVILPNKKNGGSIFLPPHLRVLHVSQEILLMPGGFLDNILLNNDMQKAGGEARVVNICKELGFNKFLLEQLAKDIKMAPDGMLDKVHKEASVEEIHHMLDDHYWSQQLSHTDFARLALARVFVMNPEVLVIHKPVVAFDDKEKHNILALIRKHVDNRGLEMGSMSDPETAIRRPRTVFMSTSSHWVEEAHECYKVTHTEVKKMTKPAKRDN